MTQGYGYASDPQFAADPETIKVIVELATNKCFDYAQPRYRIPNTMRAVARQLQFDADRIALDMLIEDDGSAS